MKPSAIVIGGGITGLVTAYKLSKKGYKVTVFESSYFLGGQASVINIDGNKIERGYHHLFKNDKEINYFYDLYKHLLVVLFHDL